MVYFRGKLGQTRFGAPCDCAAVAASVGALDGGFGLVALRGGAGVAGGSIFILSGRCYVQDTFVMCE